MKLFIVIKLIVTLSKFISSRKSWN